VPSGYQQWLHMTRLGIAQQAQKRAQFQATMESYWEWCTVCGVRTASVRIERVKYAGAELIVTGCPTHLPILADTARQALTAQAADYLLADGRRAGDVAVQVVADQLAGKDGQHDRHAMETDAHGPT
jgi:hypothetical protein